MALSFIAFHIGDYQRDTMHLSLEGHGAYLLLLQHCWTHGRIPADDKSRAAICKVPVSRWRKQLAPMVAGYFDANGENKRANAEIAKAEKMRLQKAMAGHNGGAEAQRRKQAAAIAAVKRPSSGREATKKEDKITSSEYDAPREGLAAVNNVDKSSATTITASDGLSEILQKKGWVS